MVQCILTGDELTPENDSKAHIIPSALGGRLKPKGILCKVANSTLGDRIDQPMIAGMEAIMTLLNGSRDRGENPAIEVEDESGERLVFRFGETLKTAKPEFEKIDIPGGKEFRISARTMKEARTLVGRVKKELPGFDIEEAMVRARIEHDWPDGRIKMSLQLGPRTVFPAVFVGASVAAVHAGLQPHPALRSFVQAFDPKSPTMPPDTFFFMPETSWLTTPAEVPHTIVVLAAPERKSALVAIDMFGVVTVASVLPYQGDEAVEFIHSIDVLTGQEIAAVADWNTLRGLSWSSTHVLGKYLYALLTARFAAVGKAAARQADEADTAQWIEAAIPDDAPHDLEKALETMAAKTRQEWSRPGADRSLRPSHVASFRQLCEALAKAAPLSQQAAVRAKGAELAAALDAEAR